MDVVQLQQWWQSYLHFGWESINSARALHLQQVRLSINAHEQFNNYLYIFAVEYDDTVILSNKIYKRPANAHTDQVAHYHAVTYTFYIMRKVWTWALIIVSHLCISVNLKKIHIANKRLNIPITRNNMKTPTCCVLSTKTMPQKCSLEEYKSRMEVKKCTKAAVLHYYVITSFTYKCAI